MSDDSLNPNKPILLLDVDGVLADFISATLRILKKQASDPLTASYSHNDIKTWEMFSSLPAHARHRDSVYEELKQRGGCTNIPVYAGAKEALAALKPLVDTVILTSPFKGGETWVHERELWLEKHFGISHKKMIHTGLKELVFGDILIDDKPEHIEKWAKRWRSGHAIIWDQRYNREEDLRGKNIYRAVGWNDLTVLVRRLVRLEHIPDQFRTDVS
jgi:5'(3')-deoxyribonucleotidase